MKPKSHYRKAIRDYYTRLCEQYVTEIRPYAKDGVVIVALANWKYCPIAINWGLSIHRQGIKNYAICALDRWTHWSLRRKNINSVYVKIKNNIYKSDHGYYTKHIVRIKTELPYSFIKSGIDVLLSDVDLVWMKDPLPEHINNAPSEFDIIASGGREKARRDYNDNQYDKMAIEANIARENVRVLCGGWYFVRSRPATVAFFDKVTRQIYEKEGRSSWFWQSDQRTINHLFCQMLPTITASRPHGAIDYASDQLKIRILSQSIILRAGSPSTFITPEEKTLLKSAYVIHPLSRKRSRSGVKPLQTLSLIHI